MGHKDAVNGTAPGDPPGGYTATNAFENSQAQQISRNGVTNSSRRGQGRGFNLKRVAAVLEENGVEPMKAIVEVLKSDKIDSKTRAMIELELLQYQAPKLKAVEVTQKNDLTDEEVLSRLKYLEAKAAADGTRPGEVDTAGESGTT